MRLLAALTWMIGITLMPIFAFADQAPVTEMQTATAAIIGDEAMADDLRSIGVHNAYLCSAVLIGEQDGYSVLATARHCVMFDETTQGQSDAKALWVKFYNGEKDYIWRIKAAKTDDIALLYVKSKIQRSPAPLAPEESALGQSLWIYGVSNERLWTLSTAFRAQLGTLYDSIDSKTLQQHFKTNEAKWMRGELITCAGCGHGDSGGGVWDREGQVSGILVAGQGSAFIMEPAALVERLLKGEAATEPLNHGIIDVQGAVDWQD